MRDHVTRLALALAGAFAAPTACALATEPGDVAYDETDTEPEATDTAADEDIAGPRAQLDAEHDAVDHTTVCARYCDDYLTMCGGGWTHVDDCRDACDTWPLGSTDVREASVLCRVAMLPQGGNAAAGSCIAAGPTSPICDGDAPALQGRRTAAGD